MKIRTRWKSPVVSWRLFSGICLAALESGQFVCCYQSLRWPSRQRLSWGRKRYSLGVHPELVFSPMNLFLYLNTAGGPPKKKPFQLFNQMGYWTRCYLNWMSLWFRWSWKFCVRGDNLSGSHVWSDEAILPTMRCLTSLKADTILPDYAPLDLKSRKRCDAPR